MAQVPVVYKEKFFVGRGRNIKLTSYPQLGRTPDPMTQALLSSRAKLIRHFGFWILENGIARYP